jgi:hypothetical protein
MYARTTASSSAIVETYPLVQKAFSMAFWLSPKRPPYRSNLGASPGRALRIAHIFGI